MTLYLSTVSGVMVREAAMDGNLAFLDLADLSPGLYTLYIVGITGERHSLLLQEYEEDKTSEPRLFYLSWERDTLTCRQMPQSMVLDADRMFACDFNGDGKSDIAVRTQNDTLRLLYSPVRNENGQGRFASVQNRALDAVGLGGVSNQLMIIRYY